VKLVRIGYLAVQYCTHFPALEKIVALEASVVDWKALPA